MVVALPVIFFCLFSLSVYGQAPANPQRDPLMQLLLAQPRLDVSGPINPTATFDPPVIRPGDQSVYRVSFNALEQSVDMPAEILTQPKLELKPGAHGQILQPVIDRQVPLSAFNYRVRPSAEGEVVVPEYTVKVYDKEVKVPEARLQVTAGASANQPVLLVLEVNTNLFVGQSVRPRIRFPGSGPGNVQALAQAQLTGTGFIVDQGAVHQSIQMIPPGPNGIPNYIYETTLTPISAGKVSVFAQGFSAGNRFSGTVIISGNTTIPGGVPQYQLLESEPVELAVKPLPREGELPGFTGAIGGFTVDPPEISSNVLQVGDTLKMAVTVRRTELGGNLARLVPPPAPKARNWQVLSATPSPLPPQIIQAQGFVTFQYTMVPLSEEAKETPAIPFSFFDPNRAAYVDLTIPPVAVTVNPGAVPADLQALLQTETARPGEEEKLVLSGLAASVGRQTASLKPWQLRPWFPFVQLTPAAVFIGLVAWDRRRKFLREHPEILLRRRARRALRRQRRTLRHAVRIGDAASFAAAAVSAMQAGCAPHFPAEPRALVGADVLHLLQGTNGDTADVVKKFFVVSDATRFATNPADATALLALHPQLERVLEQLETRLS